MCVFFICAVKFKRITGNKSFANGARTENNPHLRKPVPLLPTPPKHSGQNSRELCGGSASHWHPKSTAKAKTWEGRRQLYTCRTPGKESPQLSHGTDCLPGSQSVFSEEMKTGSQHCTMKLYARNSIT